MSIRAGPLRAGRTALIAAFLLAGLFAVPIATLAMFVRTPRLGAAEGAWPATRRMVFAVLMTAALAVLVSAALLAIGVTSRNVTVAVAGLIVVSIAWLPLTRRWSGRAHVCWSATTFLFASYLVFMIDWTFASHLGAGGTIGGVILWLLEVFAALLGCAYLWELCDAIGRERWLRRPNTALPVEAGREYFPFVSLHVPAHYEPPDMVIETLKSLKALDYPAYEIIAIDDNTGDESLWRPLEAWCRANGVKFVHLEDWPGYKSGALNYALRHVIDPRTELIGIIDADYQVDPQFLRVCAPFFADEKLGFLQTPQDYRDWEHAPFYRRLYYSYLYFFAVSQPSRNERGGAIFAGTMGLIRRRALEAVGGWDEWCITEDAELSLRLLRSGWSGAHIDRVIWSWRHAFDIGGVEGAAVPVVLRRDSNSAHALALDDARTRRQREPHDSRAALGLSVWSSSVVRRPARPGLLLVSRCRWREHRFRRRAVVPKADRLPDRRDPTTGGARAGSGSRLVASQHRCVMARRSRCVHDLAMHGFGCRARIGPGLVCKARHVRSYAQDRGRGPLVGRRSRESCGNGPRPARSSGHRRRLVATQRPRWTTRGPALAVAHVGVRRRTLEQSGCTARSTAAGTAGASPDRVPAVIADTQGHDRFRRVGGCRCLDSRSCGAAVFTRRDRRAEPAPCRSGTRPSRRSQEASRHGETDTFTVA